MRNNIYSILSIIQSFFSFDLRSSSGQHWKDINTLGERGYVYFEESPKTDYSSSQSSANGKVWKSSLNIDPVEPSDAGRYRCRVDFEISPTRNTRIKLKLVGEFIIQSRIYLPKWLHSF